jgi:hypothetical protein
VQDVIGAHQEESFGIRQNHSMDLKKWHALVQKYFATHEYEVFVPQRGWGERIVKRLAMRLDGHGSDQHAPDQRASEWLAARWLGGTLAAVCKKKGSPGARSLEPFADLLRCPDCHGRLIPGLDEALACSTCAFHAENEGQVYNLLPSAERKELYPGERADIIDFSLAGHEKRLIEGFHDLEGIHGNKYRWISGRAVVQLTRVNPGPQRLRIRGHASAQGIPGQVRAIVNGTETGSWKLDRPGLFLLEGDLPDAASFTIEIQASPVWNVPADERALSVNLSMIRLIPA